MRQKEGNYSPQQIFNVDETGFLWKKTNRTNISRIEKSETQATKSAKNK